jgi:hypothetical protein
VLVVERRAGKKRTTGTLALGARNGRFARTYRFHSAGLFRFYVKFAGDSGNAATRSAAVYVRTQATGAPPTSGPAPQPGSGGGVTAGAAARQR